MTARPDLDALRVLAEAATPGPWFVIPQEVIRGEGGKASVALIGDTEVRSRSGPAPAPENADAAYIAACSPDRILTLIAEVERLRSLIVEPTVPCPECGRLFHRPQDVGRHRHKEHTEEARNG